MFGKNPVAPNAQKEDGIYLHVVAGSPFSTIQGEGPYAGHPATFIRLHGCNLRCWFCDTEFSAPNDPQYRVDRLVQLVRGMKNELVVITGGEPLRQNIVPLCRELWERGLKVQIETAGTLWLPALEKYAEVVVSPKTATLNPDAFQFAVAFKYVINDAGAREGFLPCMATQPNTSPKTLAAPRPGAPVYLSPMDVYDPIQNLKNRQLVAALAIEHKVFAGVQMHKFLGVQ